MEGVDEVDAHDDRAMNAQKALRIESFLERVNGFSNEKGSLAGVELDVRTAGGDVLDLRDRNDAHLPAHLDGDALEIRSACARRGGGWHGKSVARARSPRTRGAH